MPWPYCPKRNHVLNDRLNWGQVRFVVLYKTAYCSRAEVLPQQMFCRQKSFVWKKLCVRPTTDVGVWSAWQQVRKIYDGPGRCPLAYLLYYNAYTVSPACRLCINIHHYTPPRIVLQTPVPVHTALHALRWQYSGEASISSFKSITWNELW